MVSDFSHLRLAESEPPVSRSNRSHDTFHTLCLNPARHWRRLRSLHSPPDADFADRVRSIRLLSPLMGLPCAIESALYGRRVRETRPRFAPVFIIGHWRSGTTLLHNALSKDPQLGYITLFQSLAPGSFLSGRRTLQQLLRLRAPKTRPMDNVKIRMNYPSEEEFALAHMCPQSAYLGFSFPQDWPWLFERYALMQGISEAEYREWADAYRELVAKATINFDRRRVVLKNPINTARVRALLDVFPGAKFIHIHRNPYDVFRSTLHLHRAVHRVISLQRITDRQMLSNVVEFYSRMMHAYFEQSSFIPDGDLVEVRYDDLMAAPLDEIERVYHELGLGGWTAARGRIEEFLESRQKFVPNRYVALRDERELVERHWGFALDRLGYREAAAAAVSQ